jgi:tetratricopeptide (TPR) repeat protein
MVDNQIEVEIDTGTAPNEYVVRVVHAPSGGEPEGTVELAVDELLERRQRVEETVLASSARARGGALEELERPLRQVGQDLFDALFGGSIAGVYRSSQAVALDRGKRLRVVLRLRAPELSVLPWEAMWDQTNEAYVCRREPLVRHVPAPSPVPLPVEPPLHILGLVASPRSLPSLDVEAEQQHFEEALAVPVAEGRVHLQWEAQASWDRVLDRLLTGRWHVVHFIGHGDYDETTGEGRLALVDADGRADWVEASRLADLLGEADPTPRLVVLNSCSSGAGGARDLFSGTAATLVRCGISAVAAMQFRVSDRAAVAFPRGFYTALAAGRAVDEAVRSGRIAILGAPHSLEWVTPVLYVRGNATHLFDLALPARAAGPPKPAETEPSLSSASADATEDPGWADALSALYADRLPEAIEQLSALADRYPHDGRVQDRLATARREAELAAWYGEAEAAADRHDWSAAIAALERIIHAKPDFRDAGPRLDQARMAQRREPLIEEINALARAGRWAAVLEAGEQLAGIDPSHADPDGTVTRARQALAEQELATRYGDALRHIDDRRWQAAAELLAGIERRRPGYRDTAALLARARSHVDPGIASGPRPSAAPTLGAGHAYAPAPAAVIVHHTGLQIARWRLRVAFSPDGASLATGGGSWVRIWNIRTGQQRWGAKAAGWNSTPRRARSGGRWSAMAGASLAVAGRTPGTVTGVAFSPDGRRIATASDDASARMWDLDTGQVWSTMAVAAVAELTDVAFSPDGSRIATCGSDTAARIWDAATGHHLVVVSHAGPVSAVAFSADASRLATAGDDNAAHIWDVATGNHQVAVHHSGPVHGVAFSADGSHLATAGEDNAACIWDVATGNHLLTIGHTRPVNGVAYRRDGACIATSCDDGTARVFAAATGTELICLRCPAAVTDVCFNPDGTRIATASDDKMARIWDVTSS